MIAHSLPHPMTQDPSSRPHAGCGGVLVTIDGRPLPLSAATVRADACAGLARVVLEQTFTNPYTEPLHVTYRMPLPADGAVSGYRFRLRDREIVGEVDRKDRARERFEQALVDGHTAALLEEERSSVFTQEIGNLPPGESLTVELVIDQVLAWLGEGLGGWEWRFPTVVAPRYPSGPAEVPDADRVAVETTADRLPITLALALLVRDELADARPDSPSHALAVITSVAGTSVRFAGAAALDRDIVVRWSVARPDTGAALDAARPPADHARARDGFGLLTLVPPTAGPAKLPRDLVVLIDTSGSMGGAPLEQARRLCGALVDRLDEHDRLEMIEFSMRPRRWTKQAVPADAANRAKAHAWLRSLQANGGTEMLTGILEALASLRVEAQRQIVVITDGLIGFESRVVAEIHRRLPAGSRVHTVGVGSAVNRSLTLPAARAGRGSETIIGIDEDPERAIARVLARTGAPTVVDLSLSGDALVEHAPLHLPDLMGGAPARVAVRLSPSGGTLRIEGRSSQGLWSRTVTVPALEHGTGSAAVVALFGREKVEDLEMIRAADEASPTIEHEITALGLDFQISTRLTSWVAIDRERSVDPRTPTRRDRVPQALPHGTSVAGLGLRPAVQPMPMQYAVTSPAAPMAAAGGAFETSKGAAIAEGAVRAVHRVLGRRASPPPPASPAPEMDEQLDAEMASTTGVHTRFFELRAEIVGRFTTLADGTLVVEIDAPAAGLEWHVPLDVELELADGRRVRAIVDATRTTLAGIHNAGTRIRLVCPGAGSFGPPLGVHIGGAAALVIRPGAP